MQGQSRVRRSVRQWQNLIHQLEASGLSMAAFSRQHGVGYPSLCAWRKRLQEDSSSSVAEPVALFQPITLPQVPVADRRSGGLSLSLRLGERFSLSLQFGDAP